MKTEIPAGVPLPPTRTARVGWKIAEYEFARHPLVRAARYLMFRAEMDIRIRLIHKTRFDKCVCGHERQRHLPNYGDPNYSNGICKYCLCVNFMMVEKEKTDAKT